MKTIIAHVPARKIGKFTTQSYAATFDCDDDGRWTYKEHGEKLLESEVIDVCQKATNWKEIRQAHFPMVGFHN